MNTKSAKAKGRRLQDRVREDLIKVIEIPAEMVRCAVMGETGEDIKVAHPWWPFAMETGNQERVNVWAKWDQACRHAAKDGTIPVLVIAKNRRAPLVVLDWEWWLPVMLRPWLAEQRRQVSPPAESQT